MYSIFKNIILKKLKFVIAGFLLITILPDNAGVKNDGWFFAPTSDNIHSGHAVNRDSLDIRDKVPGEISGKVSEKLDDTINHYIQNTHEISATGKSLNFFLSVQ